MDGNKFSRDEVGSIYVDDEERFVVSLIVGYQPGRDEGVDTPRDAALAALQLTAEGAGAWCGTTWFVYDRKTKTLHSFEQDTFARPVDGGWEASTCGECPACHGIPGFEDRKCAEFEVTNASEA